MRHSKIELEAIFGILTGFFLVLFLLFSLEYPARVRLFPSIVITFTLALNLLILLRPLLPERVKKYTEAGLDIMSADSFSKNEMIDKASFFKNLLVLLFYFILIYGIGFLISTFVFIYLFLKLNKYDTKKAILHSILSSIVIYVIFGLVMEVPLPQGVIVEWMGL